MGLKTRIIENYPMVLNPTDKGISRVLLEKGKREQAFMWLLREEASGTAFDIGANIGYTTISLADRCERVLAFEPDKRSRKLLEKNIEVNGFKNVTISSDAISDHCFETEITLTDKPNLTTLCNGQKGKKKTVRCTTIDTHVKFSDNPLFIKMDIEGAETQALDGGFKAWDGLGAVKILIEVHPQYYGDHNDFADILLVLMEKGFRFKYIISAKGGDKEIERHYQPFKTFDGYNRKIYKDIDSGQGIYWATNWPKNKKKVVRAILLERNGENPEG